MVSGIETKNMTDVHIASWCHLRDRRQQFVGVGNFFYDIKASVCVTNVFRFRHDIRPLFSVLVADMGSCVELLQKLSGLPISVQLDIYFTA